MGPEVSFFVVSDGIRALPIGTAQDHKRIFDDDQGPNTGGMGAFAPSPLIDDRLHHRVMAEIVEPVIAGMASEGRPYRGVLYVGLMLTATGPKVIEFNVRLGDPEAQVILPLINEPLLPLLMDSARGHLQQTACRLSSQKLVGVVVASRGYPESSESGQPITGIEEAERAGGVRVLHAGTAFRNHQLVTAGGRVLTVVAPGESFAEAIAQAYAGVARVHFDGMQYRNDIGRKALSGAVRILERDVGTLAEVDILRSLCPVPLCPGDVHFREFARASAVVGQTPTANTGQQSRLRRNRGVRRSRQRVIRIFRASG